MSEFFLTIVNMSMSASWIVLAVLLRDNIYQSETVTLFHCENLSQSFARFLGSNAELIEKFLLDWFGIIWFTVTSPLTQIIISDIVCEFNNL